MSNQPAIRKQEATAFATFPAKSFFLFGEPKVGKTETAGQFPRNLMLNVLAENGAGRFVGDVIDIVTPEDLTQVVAWLRADPQCRGYATVTLDGVSTFVLDRQAALQRATNYRDPRKLVKAVTDELKQPLYDFLSLPCIRVLTGHARKETEEVQAGNRRVVKTLFVPDLPPRLRKFVEGKVDAFGYCYTTPQGAAVRWLPLEVAGDRPQTIEAGNRLGLPQITALSYKAIESALVKRVAPPAPSPNGKAAPVPPAPRPAPVPNGKPAAPAARPVPPAPRPPAKPTPPVAKPAPPAAKPAAPAAKPAAPKRPPMPEEPPTSNW